MTPKIEQVTAKKSVFFWTYLFRPAKSSENGKIAIAA